MLQETFYTIYIVFAGVGIVFLVVLTWISFKLYRSVAKLVDQANEKFTEISGAVAEMGEHGSALLRMASDEGRKAEATTTVISTLLNGYFIARDIFGKKKSRKN